MRKILLFQLMLFLGTLCICLSQQTASAYPNQKKVNKKHLDRIIIQKPESSSRLALRGTITEYTGNRIVIQSSVNKSVRQFPTSHVVKVSTSHVIPYLRGMKFYSQKNFSDATDAFEKAIALEDRKWVRREILAMLIRTALQTGQYKKATSRFIMLTESDSETFYFHLIPLQWSASQFNLITQLDGLSWMQSKSASTRLIGASRLLLDKKYSHFAAIEMKKLASAGDQRIHHLAKMQLWRLELQQPKNITQYQLDRWQKQIETIPSDYRAGGWYLLGTAFAQKRDYEKSATALLWLPMVYDQDRFLAARSCLQAAESLLSIGKKREANTLLQEVVIRFNNTPAAKQATITLQKLHRP